MDVAVKKIKLAIHGRIHKSFITESFLLFELHHENILRMESSFVHDDSIWLVSEQCTMNLDKLICLYEEKYPTTIKVDSLSCRAPELLSDPNECYSSAIDMWPVGCIFGIMARYKIARVHFAGLFTGYTENNILYSIHMTLEKESPSLRTIFPDLDADGFNLLQKLLNMDPAKRITAADALEHPYIKSTI